MIGVGVWLITEPPEVVTVLGNIGGSTVGGRLIVDVEVVDTTVGGEWIVVDGVVLTDGVVMADVVDVIGRVVVVDRVVILADVVEVDGGVEYDEEVVVVIVVGFVEVVGSE
jgi:hypothetical protein